MKNMNKISFIKFLKFMCKMIKINIEVRRPISLVISILGFGMAFIPVLISNILKYFTDSVQELYGTGISGLLHVLMVFFLLVSLYVIQTLYNFMQEIFALEDREATLTYLKEHILRCKCNINYKYIENFDDFAEKIDFIDAIAVEKAANSIQALIIGMQGLVTFFCIIFVLSEVSFWIILLLLVTCIPAAILSYKQKDEDFFMRVSSTKERSFASLYFKDACSLYSINEVRFFKIFSYIKNLWKKDSLVYIHKKREIIRKHIIYNSIADIFRNGVYIVILLITAAEIFRNPAIGLGIFLLVFTLADQFQTTTTNLLITIVGFTNDINYMKCILDIDNFEYEYVNSETTPFVNADIKMKNVNFTYPDTNKQVLKNICVSIKQGEKIAIVGENGSGKTTFVNLLCALYVQDSGEISIGDKNIHKNIQRVRKSISAVFQDFGKYEASIRENITISDSEKKSTDDDMDKLTRITGLYDFIYSQPDKYNEILGSFDEDGSNLSGGQWQRLALSRAAYRDEARIMILDEPTAALDPIAEANIYRNFSQLTGDKTVILISHRLGICSIVDRIIVFDNGSIIEDGSHEELIKNNGKYAKLYQSQAQWYEKDLAKDIV